MQSPATATSHSKAARPSQAYIITNNCCSVRPGQPAAARRKATTQCKCKSQNKRRNKNKRTPFPIHIRHSSPSIIIIHHQHHTASVVIAPTASNITNQLLSPPLPATPCSHSARVALRATVGARVPLLGSA